MTIKKILSCGRSGAELAALDTAIKLGIAHGGWTSRGKRNEDGPLPAVYDLKETNTLGYNEALEKNVIASDGTLIISTGSHTSAATKAVQTALKHQRQFLHVDLKQYAIFEAASISCAWMFQKLIRTVYITGPTSSEEPRIYGQVRKLLETAFYLGHFKTGMHEPYAGNRATSADTVNADFPQSVADAVQRLKSVLSLKERSALAKMPANELNRMNSGLGEYIKKHFGLYNDNTLLMRSCAEIGHLMQPLPDEACAVIMRSLLEELRKTHTLRVIK